MDLSTKLTMARYNTAFNEKSYENLRSLRQAAAFALYQSIHPNLTSAVFNNGVTAIAKALKIQTECPWLKTCNQKVILVMPLCNQNPEPLEEIQILLHGCNTTSITYTTKLYQLTQEAPYWKEIKTQNITKNTLSTVAAVIDLTELKNNVVSKIEFGGVIMYKIDGKEKLLPFEKVTLSVMDTLAEKFDVLSSNKLEKNDLLAILATSQKTDLIFRQVQNEDNDTTTLINLLCTNLKMERVTYAQNLVLLRQSPYHALNGLMIVFHDGTVGYQNYVEASVYTRSESQVLSLIHYINEAIPERIIITTATQTMSRRNQDLMISGFHNESPSRPTQQINLQPLANSLLKQMSILIEYYDKCMIKMNESRNENVIEKIGCEIDLFACGVPDYLEIKKRLNEQMSQGISLVSIEASQPSVADSESMHFDSGE